MTTDKKQNIALVIALTFHFFGLIGILFTNYKDWFLQSTYINLLVTFSLTLFTNYRTDDEENSNQLFGFNKQFLLFVFIAFSIGFIAEVIGVNTQKLFGNYKYGDLMGKKIFNVPLLIGVQWFVTVYCCGVFIHHIGNWASKKIDDMGGENATNQKIQTFSMLFDAALLATIFDYILEPAAQKLGYWQWSNNEIPFFNYACWFVISLLIFLFFNKLKFNKQNKFAVHLLFIQTIFFLAIRFYY